jgi:hypothetical protein
MTADKNKERDLFIRAPPLLNQCRHRSGDRGVTVSEAASPWLTFCPCFGVKSLIPFENSLFFEIFSLIICVGNCSRSDCSAAVSWYSIVPLSPRIAKFPVKFPDTREFAWRRARSALRRQPGGPGSVPDTWVTVYTEDIGNTFGPKLVKVKIGRIPWIERAAQNAENEWSRYHHLRPHRPPMRKL